MVDNGNVDLSSGTLFGESVTVTCNDGYDISGTATWTCADSGWDATASCEIQGNNFRSIFPTNQENLRMNLDLHIYF